MNGLIAGDHGGRSRRGSAGRKSGQLAALVLTLALAGCAQTPDWVNPVNWFDDSFDGVFEGWFSDDVEQLPAVPKMSDKTPGADKPYPKLGRTQAPSNIGASPEARKKLANSLIADRDNAKYTNQDLRADNNRLAVAPPPPPKPALIPTAKPMAKRVAPERIKDLPAKRVAAVPAAEGTAARSASPSLPSPRSQFPPKH